MRRGKLLGLGILFAGVANLAVTNTAGADDIKIGEINSYSILPAFTEPYRKGWQLAVEEINAAGGINGNKVVVISAWLSAISPTKRKCSFSLPSR
jgi:branched-chain amino acid transport system substrate-binding protein